MLTTMRTTVLLTSLLFCPAQSALNTQDYKYNRLQTPQTNFPDANDIFTSIRESLLQSSIIPEVLHDFVPSCVLAPYYSKKHISVTLGNTIKPKNTKTAPTLKIWCPDVKEDDEKAVEMKGLTIVLTDPDAPSRDDPEWSEVCHWIAKVPVKGNIKKGGLGDGEGMELDVGRGGVEDVKEYKPPGPPPKTGYHRYVFVLLGGDNTNLTAPGERKHWGTDKDQHGVRQWAKEQGLVVLGANYFVAKNKKQT